MHYSRSILPFFVAVVAATATAQSGRSMKRMAPVVLGGTAAMVMQHPTTIAGNVYALAACSPSYPGTLPLAIPGVITGVLRLDPLAFGWLQFGVLDASGQTAPLSFAVPNDPLLVGASFDVQGADLDAAGLITLTDNELETEVAAPPPASLNMLAIAPGTFQMGSPVTPLYVTPYFNNLLSQPVHPVTITRPFWMGKYEVTQAEFVSLMGANPAYSAVSSLPVDQVTWYEAATYCEALTVQEAAAGRLPSDYEYRLPTEAEWEYCCRAGTTTEYAFGTTLSCGRANCLYDEDAGSYCSINGLTVVGSYMANAWGLHDMHGNVWEYCLDSWGGPNYPSAAVVDPYVTGGDYRMVRGGRWITPSYDCRSAVRGALHYNVSVNATGFRVVCAPALP